MEETELLRRYVREKSEEAFRELVRREIPLVYSAALRQVGGNPHLAEEVTQAVFTALATKAPRIMNHPSLSGWLHTSTHFAATKLLRSERRRRHHEAQAGRETTTAVTPPAADTVSWREVAAVLDDAVRDLKEPDRQAVLLRFFEGHSLAAIGTRLGLSEDATRKRIDRALQLLRSGLERRGLACSVAALSATLTEGAIATVPAGLAASAATGALTVAAAVPAAAVGTFFFAMNKVAIVSIGAALAVTVVVTTHVVSKPTAIAEPMPSAVATEKVVPVVTPPNPAITGEASGPTPSRGPQVAAAASDAAAVAAEAEKRQLEQLAADRAQMLALRAAEAARLTLSATAPAPAIVDVAAISALKESGEAVAFFRKVPTSDLLPQLQYLFTLPAGETRNMLLSALFQAWTERDASAAMSAAASGGRPIEKLALDGWARTDLPAAWAWANSSGVNSTINHTAVIAGAAKDKQEAIIAEWLLAPPKSSMENYQEASDLTEGWAMRDPSGAAQWLKRLEGVNPGAAAGAASALGHSSATLPIADFSALVSGQSARLGDLMLSAATRAWVQDNQLTRLQQYAAANPIMSDTRLDMVMGSIGMALRIEDPDLALQIYLKMRNPEERDRYLGNATASGSMPGGSREKAMAFALAIGDETQRTTRVRQAYQNWLKADAARAQAYIARPSFPSDLRKQLEQLAP